MKLKNIDEVDDAKNELEEIHAMIENIINAYANQKISNISSDYYFWNTRLFLERSRLITDKKEEFLNSAFRNSVIKSIIPLQPDIFHELGEYYFAVKKFDSAVTYFAFELILLSPASTTAKGVMPHVHRDSTVNNTNPSFTAFGPRASPRALSSTDHHISSFIPRSVLVAKNNQFIGKFTWDRIATALVCICQGLIELERFTYVEPLLTRAEKLMKMEHPKKQGKAAVQGVLSEDVATSVFKTREKLKGFKKDGGDDDDDWSQLFEEEEAAAEGFYAFSFLFIFMKVIVTGQTTYTLVRSENAVQLLDLKADPVIPEEFRLLGDNVIRFVQ
jgi:hypothetical protein